MLFVIDGTDGSGKQTQFELLKGALDSQNIEYKTVMLLRHFMQLIDMQLLKKIMKNIIIMEESF